MFVTLHISFLSLLLLYYTVPSRIWRRPVLFAQKSEGIKLRSQLTISAISRTHHTQIHIITYRILKKCRYQRPFHRAPTKKKPSSKNLSVAPVCRGIMRETNYLSYICQYWTVYRKMHRWLKDRYPLVFLLDSAYVSIALPYALGGILDTADSHILLESLLTDRLNSRITRRTWRSNGQVNVLVNMNRAYNCAILKCKMCIANLKLYYGIWMSNRCKYECEL